MQNQTILKENLKKLLEITPKLEFSPFQTDEINNLKDFLNSFYDYGLILDLDFNIKFINEYTKNKFYFQNLISTNFLDLIQPDFKEKIRKKLKDLIFSNIFEKINFLLKINNNEYEWVLGKLWFNKKDNNYIAILEKNVNYYRMPINELIENNLNSISNHFNFSMWVEDIQNNIIFKNEKFKEVENQINKLNLNQEFMVINNKLNNLAMTNEKTIKAYYEPQSNIDKKIYIIKSPLFDEHKNIIQILGSVFIFNEKRNRTNQIPIQNLKLNIIES